MEVRLAYLICIKEEINKAIDKLDNRNEQLLLRYRYLDNCTWEEIAAMLNVSIRSVHRISQGGIHDRSNLMSLCKSCHNKIYHEIGDR